MFNEAIRIDPKNAYAYINKGQIFYLIFFICNSLNCVKNTSKFS